MLSWECPTNTEHESRSAPGLKDTFWHWRRRQASCKPARESTLGELGRPWRRPIPLSLVSGASAQLPGLPCAFADEAVAEAAASFSRSRTGEKRKRTAKDVGDYREEPRGPMIPTLKLLGARGASGILQVPELMQRCATQRLRRSANSLDQADAQAKGG